MKKKAASTQRVSFETVRQLALALPGIEEGTSYGTPALKVRGRLLARLREDGETLVIKIDFSDRDLLMQAEPDTFFVTDHYVSHPLMLVRLASVRREQLRILLEDAWRCAAPKRLVSTYDAGK
ncbi:MmcQ/YjbR family DNA-binding protein [Archangium gephyra]|uniref:MmcQ/YjbR family DNA-binding protein n=1 Tax=Archangium gephyra TaxID=48 RepID=UPI0035D426B6